MLLLLPLVLLWLLVVVLWLLLLLHMEQIPAHTRAVAELSRTFEGDRSARLSVLLASTATAILRLRGLHLRRPPPTTAHACLLAVAAALPAPDENADDECRC